MGDVPSPGQHAVGFFGALTKDQCALGDRHARPPGADASNHRVSRNVGKGDPDLAADETAHLGAGTDGGIERRYDEFTRTGFRDVCFDEFDMVDTGGKQGGGFHSVSKERMLKVWKETWAAGRRAGQRLRSCVEPAQD